MNTCPVNCISMQADSEGFVYPVADENCIRCGKCENVCPIVNKNIERQPNIEQYAAAAISKNMAVWKESSSGGAFTEICNSYSDPNTVIFGAAFAGLTVEHSYVIGPDNIKRFRKSKYVQSNITHCYKQTELFLKQGRKVIFSGTPCQLAGLRSFLHSEYDNLLCVGFICHGVGSPEVFKKFCEYISKKYGSKIISYSFRNKACTFGNLETWLSHYRFANNKDVYVNKDGYTRLYLSQLCLRPSCGTNCRFRRSDRMSDITIADFKKKDETFPKMRDYRNYSTIVVNSKKGDHIMDLLNDRMDIKPCDLDTIKHNNPLFARTTSGNPCRGSFFEDFEGGMPIQDLVKKYITSEEGRKLKRFKALIPQRMRFWYREIKRFCTNAF